MREIVSDMGVVGFPARADPPPLECRRIIYFISQKQGLELSYSNWVEPIVVCIMLDLDDPYKVATRPVNRKS